MWQVAEAACHLVIFLDMGWMRSLLLKAKGTQLSLLLPFRVISIQWRNNWLSGDGLSHQSWQEPRKSVERLQLISWIGILPSFILKKYLQVPEMERLFLPSFPWMCTFCSSPYHLFVCLFVCLQWKFTPELARTKTVII